MDPEIESVGPRAAPRGLLLRQELGRKSAPSLKRTLSPELKYYLSGA